MEIVVDLSIGLLFQFADEASTACGKKLIGVQPHLGRPPSDQMTVPEKIPLHYLLCYPLMD